MSDQYSTTAPVTPRAGGENASPTEQKSAIQPQYLTLEEANRMATNAEERAFKRAQSLIEQTNAGVLKKVQGDLKSLEQSLALQKKAGIEITADQEEKLKQQVIQKAFTEVDVSPAVQPDVPAQNIPAQPDNIDPITAEAVKMMQDAGVWIDDDDPEADVIDQSSIYAYLESVKKAIETKRQRMGTPAPARVAGGGIVGQSTSNILPDGIPPIERLNRYFQNKR